MSQPFHASTGPLSNNSNGGDGEADCPAGRVGLVGAGPGDPELLTLRGLRWLRQCDVVLYDGLSNTEILRHANRAVHTCVGKHGQSRIWKQSEIIDEMLRHAQAGHTVVRLKGGDPAVFARTSEEVDALRASGIEFEIVPGITAALAAGSYAGIPVTHRGYASAVALVTGHENPDKEVSSLDWHALAAFPGTLVVYMGVTSVKSWTSALLKGGKDPATPCAILRRCTLPDQQRVHCRLDEVADRLTPASKMRPPVITIVGPVTELAESMDWFAQRTLTGKRILVSRPQVDAEGESPRGVPEQKSVSDSNEDVLTSLLRELGADVVSQPAIAIRSVEDPARLDDVIMRLRTFDWILFSSRHGVRYFMARMRHLGYDSRAFGGVKLAAVGPSTAQELHRHGLQPDLVPKTSSGRALAESLTGSANGDAFLSIRGTRGEDHFVTPLTDAGGRVDEVVVYEQLPVSHADPSVVAMVRDQVIDWVVITSADTARHLHRMLGDNIWHARAVAISSAAANVVADLGGHDTVVADQPGIQPLVDAIVNSERQL